VLPIKRNEKIRFKNLLCLETKFFIIVPCFTDFEPSSGTSIRIAGYTSALNDLNVDYRFLSSVKPEYVPAEKHELQRMHRRWTKVFLIHNILFTSDWLFPLSYLIRLLVRQFAKIDKLSDSIGNRIIWSHQDNTLAMYLYYVYGKLFIYDIHGLLDIQLEYRSDLNIWRKLWFDLYLKHEKIVLKKAPYINVVSTYMGNYVKNTFSPQGNILLAPDAIPAPLYKYKQTKKSEFRKSNILNKDEKILLFAGSFKKIGGVTELLRTFIKDENLLTTAVLILVGNGQEEEQVNKLIYSTKHKGRIFRIDSMPHDELISLMQVANVLVCPDIESNLYNQMTPHIKLFDAIASGKNVVASDLKVNRDIFDPQEFNIYYFSFEKKNSLKDALNLALNTPEKEYNRSILNELTYYERAKKYLKYYN